MSRKTSSENCFPLGEPTRPFDVCSTSPRRRKSEFFGMAGVDANCSATKGSAWYPSTTTRGVLDTLGGNQPRASPTWRTYERLGRSTQRKAFRGPATKCKRPMQVVLYLAMWAPGLTAVTRHLKRGCEEDMEENLHLAKFLK